MITLLGSLLGFFSSWAPYLFRFCQDKQDKAHEIEILQMQMQFSAQNHTERVEEINANADIVESTALYQTYKTGINWIDALNGTVRPVLTYAFFLLYSHAVMSRGWVWTEEDQAIFAGIISFYFGNRAMQKARGY